ncbi:MAG: hypothetical protein SNJ78_05060 [Spirochaetales bacterium]
MNRMLWQVNRFFSMAGILLSLLTCYLYLLGSFQRFIPSTQYLLLILLYVLATMSFWSGVNLLLRLITHRLFNIRTPRIDLLLGSASLVGGAFFLFFSQVILSFLQASG